MAVGPIAGRSARGDDDRGNAVLDAIDRLRPAMLTELAGLVAVPSVGGSDAELDIQDLLGRRWAAEGLDVSSWDIDIPALERDADFPGMEVPRSRARGVIARLPGTGGDDARTLLLDAHVDVVPPGDRARWSDGPYDAVGRRMEGRDVMLGRGTCDMKAGLVAAWYAVRALADSGIRLRGDLLLAPVAGEEDGGLGTYALLNYLRDNGIRPAACVVPEPTDLDLVPVNGGALTFRLTIRGRATHASRRTEGVSAVEAFVPILAALRELESQRNADVDPLMARWPIAYPLSIGTVRAGDWASSVPDLLEAEGRLGVALGEDVADARIALESAIDAACADDPTGWLRDHPVEVTWWGGQFASGLPALGDDGGLLATVAAAHRRAGGSPQLTYGGPYGSDLRLLTGVGGIPTIQYGPGDTRVAHAADEHVALDDVVTTARTLALVAIEVCGIG